MFLGSAFADCANTSPDESHAWSRVLDKRSRTRVLRVPRNATVRLDDRKMRRRRRIPEGPNPEARVSGPADDGCGPIGWACAI